MNSRLETLKLTMDKAKAYYDKINAETDDTGIHHKAYKEYMAARTEYHEELAKPSP